MATIPRLEQMARSAIARRPGQMMVRGHGLTLKDPSNHDLQYGTRFNLKPNLYLAADTVDPSAKGQRGKGKGR